MITFPEGVRQKMEIPEGRGGTFCEPILENPEGRGGHKKNPFRGGVWIFSGTTQYKNHIYENSTLSNRKLVKIDVTFAKMLQVNLIICCKGHTILTVLNSVELMSS